MLIDIILKGDEMASRHDYTQHLNPDFVAYVRDLEQAADTLEGALVTVQRRHPCPDVGEVTTAALRAYARVRQDGPHYSTL